MSCRETASFFASSKLATKSFRAVEQGSLMQAVDRAEGFYYRISDPHTLLVIVPNNGDGGAVKVLLKLVVEPEVADGVVQDVQLIHDSSCHPSHFIAD